MRTRGSKDNSKSNKHVMSMRCFWPHIPMLHSFLHGSLSSEHEMRTICIEHAITPHTTTEHSLVSLVADSRLLHAIYYSALLNPHWSCSVESQQLNYGKQRLSVLQPHLAACKTEVKESLAWTVFECLSLKLLFESLTWVSHKSYSMKFGLGLGCYFHQFLKWP